MRILHVSDLHFGRALGDLSREPEQRALVGELTTLARELDVAMTVISGDVFDAYTPPAWAEDLFFTLLDGLADGGERAVAVIAGNHDSGLRLAAAEPLARRLGILLAGDVTDTLTGFDGGSSRVRIVPLAPQVARVEVPGRETPIVIGLLPFVSEARVARDPSDDVSGSESRYAAYLRAELASRTILDVDGSVRLLALHQYVTGAASSDSERRLRIGAISDIDADAIPAGLDYVALGHLHRPQEIVGSASRAHYAGSPIAYSFSETGQIKRAVLIEIDPKREGLERTRVTTVPLTSGRPLEVWSIASIEEAAEKARAAEGLRAIVEVRATFGRRLGPADGEALFALPGVTVVSVRDLYSPLPGPTALLDEVRELAVEDLFRELWMRRHGEEPDLETMRELGLALLEVGRPGESRGTA